MEKSPYLVEPSEKPKNAIKFAIERGLFNKFRLEKNLVNGYLNSKFSIPIWIIEAACNINREDIKAPVQYQYVWFCLHGTKVSRVQPSGRKFNSIVNFSSCYIKSNDKIKKLITRARNSINLPQAKFSVLCGYKYGNLRFYNNKIPITAILKVSQIFNFNIWKLLENYELFGKTSSEGGITIPKFNNLRDINLILIWLKTEGHLELSSTHIEINQKNNKESLEKLRHIIIKTFKLKGPSGDFPKGKRGEDRLIISSSPLRQLLCLKYIFLLDYKSGCLERTNLDNLSKEEYKKLAAAFIQTEGCLSSHYTRNRKKKLPRFEFMVKDASLAEDCIFVLKKLKFNPLFYIRENLFKVGIYNSKEVIRLLHLTGHYFLNRNKIDYLRKICTNGIEI